MAVDFGPNNVLARARMKDSRGYSGIEAAEEFRPVSE
jgi:hypothetical protein